MNKGLIILLSVIGFWGCLSLDEGDSDCPGYFRLKFVLEESRGLAESITSDMVLYQFSEGSFVTERRIDNQQIKSGKEISFRKGVKGATDFMAWGTFDKDDLYNVPQFNVNDKLSSRNLQLPRSSGGDYQPFGNIFLGVDTDSGDYTATSVMEIRMKQANCNLNVNVHDNLDVLTENTASIIVSGVKSEMNLNFEGTGADAEIPFMLGFEGSEKYTTGTMGLLPSSETQTICVDIVDNGNPVYRVQTDLRSVSGRSITINISLGVTAEIIVDGWRIKDVPIERL